MPSFTPPNFELGVDFTQVSLTGWSVIAGVWTAGTTYNVWAYTDELAHTVEEEQEDVRPVWALQMNERVTGLGKAPRIELESSTRTFGDPADPNGHFTITLRPLSIPEASIAGQNAKALEALYCGEDPQTKEPRFLLSPLGERIYMDEQFIASLAMIV